MFPTFGLNVAAQPASLLPPDSKPRSFGVDYELGAPQGAVDVSRRTATYTSRLVGSTVEVSANDTTWLPIITVAGISPSFSFSFDQLMRATVCYQLGAGLDTTVRDAYLYWYDQTLPGFTTLTVSAVKSPLLSFDYALASSALGAEMVMWYVKSGTVYYRRQSDRFTVEYSYAALPAGTTRITGAGLGRKWRYLVRCGR